MSSLRRFLRLFCLITIVSTLLVVGQTGACSDAEVVSCALRYLPTNLSTSASNSEQLQYICGISEAAISCVNRSNCGDALIAGMRHLFDCVCTEHRQDFLDNWQCFHSQQSLNWTEHYSTQADSSSKEGICEISYRLINCSAKFMRQFCGIEANAFFDGLLPILRDQVSAVDDCPQPPHSETTPVYTSRSEWTRITTTEMEDTTVANGACDQTEVTRCLAIVQIPEKSKFTYTRAELEAVCRLVDEFVNCIKATGCANEDQGRAALNVVKISTDYICKQHKEEFLEHAQCLGSKNLEKSGDYCKEKANLEHSKTPCETASQMMSCLVKSVESCCGKKASDLIDDYFKVTLQQSTPLVTSGNCQLRTDLDVDILQLCNVMNGCVKLVQCAGTTLLAFIILALLRNDWI